MKDLHSIFSFISPAEYAEVSILARKVSETMLSCLELVTIQPQVILEVGCGTGEGSALLKDHYPHALLFALDNEEAMLRYHQASRKEKLICADAVQLPFLNHSIDLIFANLVLPWCMDWDAIFCEWRRVLREDGLLMFSTFGPDTLKELPEKILHLQDMHEIGDTLVKAKLKDPVMDMEYIKLSYRERNKLCYELKANGMITSDSLVPDNAQSLTHEIIYGHAWGSCESMDFMPNDEGIVTIPLSHLRRRGNKI